MIQLVHRRRCSRRHARVGAVLIALVLTGVMVESPVASASRPAAVTGLSQGAQGPSVATVQEALMRAGIHVPGGADGIFGPATAAALASFQRSRGLSVTGVVDEATARALGLAGASAPSSSGTRVSANELVGLAPGIVGPRVRLLQEALIAAGVSGVGGTDGVYGPMTTAAVTRFQTANGLAATGSIDAATAAVLTGGRAPAAPTPVAAPAATPASPASSGANASTASAALVGLRVGSNGAAVVQLQRALLAAGIRFPGGADGIFGPATASALNTFQRRNGLPVSGRVDDATALALATPTGSPAAPAAPVTATASRVSTGLAPGAVGNAVKALQEALMAAGIRVPGGADGIFGPATANALKTFQTQRGLSPTGRVDEATAAALASPAPTPSPAPADPGSPGGFPVFGERGERVRLMQQALLAAGISVPGGADGVFGSQTAGAIMNFQRQQGLNVTGTVDEATATRLGLTPQGAPPPPSSDGIKLDAFPVQGTCHFGDTWHFPRGGGRKHEGVDIIAPEGRLIYAVTAGTITHVYHDRPGSLAGNALRLTTSDGTYYFYAHLAGFADGIGVGTRVVAGQIIGYNGSTGNAGTPHLHFEIHPRGGAAINPYPFVKAIDGCRRTEPLPQP